MLQVEIAFTEITAQTDSLACYETNGMKMMTVSTATEPTPKWSLRYSIMPSISLLNTGFESTKTICWEYLSNHN